MREQMLPEIEKNDQEEEKKFLSQLAGNKKLRNVLIALAGGMMAYGAFGGDEAEARSEAQKRLLEKRGGKITELRDQAKEMKMGKQSIEQMPDGSTVYKIEADGVRAEFITSAGSPRADEANRPSQVSGPSSSKNFWTK